MLCPHAVTDEDGHPLENEDESGTRRCEYCCKIFQAHRLHETILRCLQRAPDDVRWEIDRNEFDELMASKKESAPGPDGIQQKASTDVREAWVLQRLQTCS